MIAALIDGELERDGGGSQLAQDVERSYEQSKGEVL